jgi:predicted esterase
MTAWCDVYEPWPLTTKPRDDTKGLEASVEDIHEIIDKLVSDGIPSERIIVGGFSQGAATATLATNTYGNDTPLFSTPRSGCAHRLWLCAVSFRM